MISLAAARARTNVRVGWRTEVAPSWEFDLDALRAACAELGVTAPVEVGCAEYGRGRWGGMHTFERGVHRLRVKRAYGRERAGQVLWHELTHAAQHDRGEQMGTVAVLRHEGFEAYRAHPLEREARANEACNDRLPLTR